MEDESSDGIQVTDQAGWNHDQLVRRFGGFGVLGGFGGLGFGGYGLHGYELGGTTAPQLMILTPYHPYSLVLSFFPLLFAPYLSLVALCSLRFTFNLTSPRTRL